MKECGIIRTEKGNEFTVGCHEEDGKHCLVATGPVDGGFIARTGEATIYVEKNDEAVEAGLLQLVAILERRGF